MVPKRDGNALFHVEQFLKREAVPEMFHVEQPAIGKVTKLGRVNGGTSVDVAART